MHGFLLSCSIDTPVPRVVEHTLPGFRLNTEPPSQLVWSCGTIANRNSFDDRKLFGDPSIGNLERDDSNDSLIVGLYQTFQYGVADRIDGNYSFVIWDPESFRLFCVRDRAGSGGVYYTTSGNDFLVSDRIEFLLKHLPVKPRANTSSMVAHLNGLAPAPSETFYDGIHALNPGEALTWHGGRFEKRYYWKLESQPLLKLKSDAEYVLAYRQTILSVVPGYGSDRKSAISVSGGLDSTSVAATLRFKRPTDPLTAITWISPEVGESDEAASAEGVCRYLNLNYWQIRADIHHPMSSSEGIHTSIHSPFLNFYHDTWEATFEKVRSMDAKVLLTGHPGDSLFGGYITPYSDLLLTGRITQLFDQLTKHRRITGENAAAILFRMIFRPIAGTYLPSSFTRRLRKSARWMRPEHSDEFREAIARNSVPSRTLLPGRSRRLMLLNHPLGPHIEELQSRHARDCGVEWRSPLADHRLIEFAASLPTDQTFADGLDKMIVRRGQSGYLPDEIINQKQKILPASILRRSFVARREKLNELTTRMRAAEIGLVDERRVQESVNDYLEGGKSTELFWYVLTLEDWLRRYF